MGQTEASQELARDGADESWTAIHVPSSTEGRLKEIPTALLSLCFNRLPLR